MPSRSLGHPRRFHARSTSLTVAVILLLVGLVACGGGSSSPSAPSVPTIPTVSGNYSGTSTFSFPELHATMNCPASTVVTQSGSTVSVAPIVLTGQCGTISIPVGLATIDATGAIEGGGASGTYNEPSCGTYNYTGSGGFFGREFRLSMSASSSTCYNFNFTMVLTR